MIMFDGPGDIYEFMLSDGVNTHYYSIHALNRNIAVQIGAKWFTEEYGTVYTEAKFCCIGLPLAKNY